MKLHPGRRGSVAGRKVRRGWSLHRSGVFIAMACLTLVMGCDGSNPTEPRSPSGGCPFFGPPPNFPDRTATFQTQGSPGPNTFFLRQSTLGSCPDLLLIDVVANNVQGLGGVRFDAQWPEDRLSFDANQFGNFFGSSATIMGTPDGFTEILRPPGQSPVAGTGIVVTLAFVYLGPNGNAPFTLVGEALDPDGNPLAGFDFLGGTAVISP